MERDLHLTFDDGPAHDTDALLDVLGRHEVAATFFVVGSRVVQRRRLVRRIGAEGHTVGNHGWNHLDLTVLPLGAVRAQLERTSDAIEAATGERPSVFRPPYGFTSPAIEQVAGELGMTTMLWDVSPRDWELPGVEAIASTLRSAPSGSVVLLHDGPGDRQDTVAAVDLVLAEARCALGGG